MFPQPAHLSHVLLAAHGVDDAAGTEKQTGLEKSVGEKKEET
jgi:hypothetical protein